MKDCAVRLIRGSLRISIVYFGLRIADRGFALCANPKSEIHNPQWCGIIRDGGEVSLPMW